MSICCPNRNFAGSHCRSSAHPWETKLHVIICVCSFPAPVDQEPDRQGRVLVPQMLRDYANLGSDIVVIGVGTRADI